MSQNNKLELLKRVLIKTIETISAYSQTRKNSFDNSSNDSKNKLIYSQVLDLTAQVQELQDLTKLLAMNQTQLAADMYSLYSQVKESISMSDDTENAHIEPDSPHIDIPKKNRRHGHGGGTGGMIN